MHYGPSKYTREQIEDARRWFRAGVSDMGIRETCGFDSNGYVTYMTPEDKAQRYVQLCINKVDALRRKYPSHIGKLEIHLESKNA